jgi:hypothetical protein
VGKDPGPTHKQRIFGSARLASRLGFDRRPSTFALSVLSPAAAAICTGSCRWQGYGWRANHAYGSRARPVHSYMSIHDAPGGGQCLGRSPVDRAKQSMNSTLVPALANSSTSSAWQANLRPAGSYVCPRCGRARRRIRARSAATRPPQTPCWPMSQRRRDSVRQWPRTGQVVQIAIAAAASWLAWRGSALTGNHWSGSRSLSEHWACLITRAHNAGSVSRPGIGAM